MDGTYYVSHGGMIPVKWTAPEVLYYCDLAKVKVLKSSCLTSYSLSTIFFLLKALHFKKYSSASDVWSYGALMYEIWSMGHKPFENCNNNEVYIYIIAADSYAQPRADILLWRIGHATPIVTVQTSKFFNVTKKDNITQVRACVPILPIERFLK